MHKTKEDGFVAIVVAAMIMVILSLITIGFTRLVQREQRQALDRQLSRQALYAAESGINDVYAALKADPTLPTEKTDCAVTASPTVAITTPGNTISYTCTLYDKAPSELVYSSVSTQESKVVELITKSTANFTEIRFDWGSSNTNFLDCSTLELPSNNGTNMPMLRLELTNTSTYDRAKLIDDTINLYLRPCRDIAPTPTPATPAATSYTYDKTKRGEVVNVECASSGNQPCSIVINGLPASTKFLSRFRAIYSEASVVISAKDTAGDVKFVQAQTSIDVTAKANDIVRRLRVSIPTTPSDNYPEGVFQVFDGVCKRMSVFVSDLTDECTKSTAPTGPYFP